MKIELNAAARLRQAVTASSSFDEIVDELSHGGEIAHTKNPDHSVKLNRKLKDIVGSLKYEDFKYIETKGTSSVFSDGKTRIELTPQGTNYTVLKEV